MIRTPERTPWAAYSAFARSLPVRFATVPLAALGAFRGTNSGLAALAMGVFMLIAVLVGLQVEEWRRRRSEAHEHNAGLSRY